MKSSASKILIFSSSYNPVIGGVQTVTHNLAKQLLARGHEVRVVTNRYPIDLPSYETIEGVSVNRLLFLQPQIDHLRRGRFDLFAASLYLGPQSTWQLSRIVKRFRPDVVNVHFPDRKIESLLKLRTRFGFRLVVSLHGYDVQQFANGNGHSGNRSAALRRVRTLLSSADAVTAVSDDLLHTATYVEPAISVCARVIPNGVDLNRFAEATGYEHPRPYVLGVGRLMHKKGFDLLIDAFAQWQPAHKMELIIAGNGEELVPLQKRVQALGLGDRIHFFGEASPEQVAGLLKGSVGVAVPSRSETFGLAALEALAAGKPLLATKTGGLQEFLSDFVRNGSDNGSGHSNSKIFLAEPTVESIAANLAMLCKAGEKSNGERVCRIPEKYTWPGVAESYERVLLG